MCSPGIVEESIELRADLPMLLEHSMMMILKSVSPADIGTAVFFDSPASDWGFANQMDPFNQVYQMAMFRYLLR